MTWLTGWVYRKSHLITASAGAGTLYQVGIKVYKTTGTDGTEVVNGVTMGKVYVGSNCRDDFGDIRFTDDDGSTELNYWLDDTSLVSGTSCIFWVKVADDLDSVNRTIFIYYNKADATTTSDGLATFLFFDHFLGEALNLDYWTVAIGNTPTVTNSEAKLTTGAGYNYINTTNLDGITSGKEVRSKFRITTLAGTESGTQAVGLGIGKTSNPTSNWDGWYYYYGIYRIINDVGIGFVVVSDPTIGSYECLFRVYDGHVRFSSFGAVAVDLETDGSPVLQSNNIHIGIGYTGTIYVDWIFERKYVNPEPVHSTWGEEEEEIISITYQTDVMLEKVGITKTNSIDTRLVNRLTKTDSIDILLKKLGITKADLVDTVLKKLGVTKTNSIDVCLWNPAHPYWEYSINMLLKKLGITATDSIDILLVKLAIIDTNIIDALLKKLRIDKTNSIDVVLKQFDILKTNSIDVVLKKLGVTIGHSIDVELLELSPPPPPLPTETLLIRNENGSLWCMPISWKEHQDCPPSIRPVPLASSEYLDADTWVLKPRQLEITIRLSDREKGRFEGIVANTFESLYNFGTTVPHSDTNQYTDLYLTYDNSTYIWHYLVWISSKDYKWEYSMEAGRYVRWWTITLTCDVKDFSGSNSILPQYSLSTVTIDGHTLDFVLDFERTDKHPPMIPEWVNRTEAVDSYLWNECVLDVAYTCRMTNAEKWVMDTTLRNHSKVVYEDFIHNIFSITGAGNGVWVSSIDAQWDDTNWAKPWKVTVSIQANNSEIESKTAIVSVDSHAYLSGIDICTEKIINGGFENDFVGWTITLGSPNISTDKHHSGARSAEITYYSAIEQSFINSIPVSRIQSFGLWYSTFSSFYSGLMGLTIYYTDNTYTNLSTMEDFFAPELDWVYFDILPHLASGKTISYIRIGNGSSTSLYLDDISLISCEDYSSLDHLGTLYLDELPNAQALPSTVDVDVGVHIFYFWCPDDPFCSGFYDWVLSGDVTTLEEYTFRGRFNRESILTVLVTGDCTVTPRYHYVGCPSAETIILNPIFLEGLDDWVHDNNVYINGDGNLEVISQSGNVVDNYSFIDGWDDWSHTAEAILRTDVGYEDTYSVQLNSSGAKISQTISRIPTDEASWRVSSFTFLAKGDGVLKLTNYYTDGTNETENRTILSTEYCEWGTGYPCIPYCMPYGMIDGRIISSFSLEWVSGDVYVDYIRLYYYIDYGTISQVLTTPISVGCIENYMLENIFKGFYEDDPCVGETWAGSVTVILECTDDTNVTIPHAYNSYGTWEEDDWILSDYISGKSLKAITIIFYPEGHTIKCKKIKMVPLDDPLVPINEVIFLYSEDQYETPNFGTLYIDGIGYDTNGQSILASENHLLYGGDLDFGTHTLDFIYPPMETFDHWEVTGAISVESPTSQTTNITINGAGTITAIYNIS